MAGDGQADGEPPDLGFAKIIEDGKTQRVKIITRWIGICFLAVVAAVTAVLFKWAEDPPWLKLCFFLFGPGGIVAIVVTFFIRRLAKHLQLVDRRLESKKELPPPPQE